MGKKTRYREQVIGSIYEACGGDRNPHNPYTPDGGISGKRLNRDHNRRPPMKEEDVIDILKSVKECKPESLLDRAVSLLEAVIDDTPRDFKTFAEAMQATTDLKREIAAFIYEVKETPEGKEQTP